MSAFEDNSGKVASTFFQEELLPFCGLQRAEVLTGPCFGVDTAVIDLGHGKALATSSDPLSLIPNLGLEISAWLSVHLLVNDMATTGFAPQYAQFVLNLPDSLSRESFAEYWQHIHTFCKDVGVAITGGHTGQVQGQNSTLCGGGTMFLTAAKNKILTSNNARPGDLIIITKEAALASSSLLAMSFPETVKKKLGPAMHRQACENFYRTSVLEEALIASRSLKPNEELRAMHDVTEGGLLGAISEMASASGCGFRIETSQLPLSEVVAGVADVFDINPYYSVGAGAMIMAVKPGCEQRLLQALAKEGIAATVAGKFTAPSEGQVLVKNGKEKPFEFSGKDPYWEAFFKAFNAGLK